MYNNLQQEKSLNTVDQSLNIMYEQDKALAWYYMEGNPRPCFTPELLDNILAWYDEIRVSQGIEYIVAASKFDGAFNLGGDLSLFTQLIQAQDKAGLLKYATACIDVLYHTYTSLEHKVTTISLVQGDALGGGFEGAMSSDVLIAECSAKMGMPEILFNLFPGMGAFSLLSRKVGEVKAKQMILSGKLYSAEEMYHLGIVDVLVEDGQGVQAVYDYIKKENRVSNGIRSFRQATHCCNPVTYDELKKITTIWVDAALKLTPKDLRMMERLVKRQSAKANY
ncbi:crotonase/enoyl-CoA hydratase family protein [Ghiorsea bivora]|uniref:crotonase/enoyl-CoA hydratase family protein n=1 Tax=Ghiorsea bivora TaxID=1485545 RepID=UPI000A9ABA95|nr:crotonase/enoyl-CoA hydratase family protein [Ghiorsea bivora]